MKLLLPIALISLPLAPVAHALCGDCNGDGVVNVLDSLTAAQHAAALIILVPPAFDDCDVDSGGDVNILDALAIAQAAAGLGVTLTCAPTNQPPVVTVLSSPAQDHAIVPFYYQVADAESDPADVFWEFSTDGGSTWQAMIAQAGLTLTSPTTSLPTTPAGTDHLYLWDSWLDAPAAAGNTDVRAWADDGAAGPIASVVVDLTNATVPSSYAAEAIPTRFQWAPGTNVDFYVVARNLTSSAIMLQFSSSCQYHWEWDSGAWSSRTFFACLAVLTNQTIPASGVYEWPLVSHEPGFYSLTPGAHDLTTLIVPFSGDVFSVAIGILVQ